jgi:hypothetical protein
MKPRYLSESQARTLHQFPSAEALLSSLNLDGLLRVLELHTEEKEGAPSHLQLCVCGVRASEAEVWATEHSDASALRIYLAGSVLWFGALTSQTEPSFLHLQVPHGQYRYASQYHCHLRLSFGAETTGIHAWANEERCRLRTHAAESLLIPLMQQLDQLGDESLALGLRNSIRTLGNRRSAAVYGKLVPRLIDGWMEANREQRLDGAGNNLK